MPDNGIITQAQIDSMMSSVTTTNQRLSLKQLFVSKSDTQGVNSLPIHGDLSSPGLVIWTTTVPFSLTSTTNTYNLTFSDGVVFNLEPNVTFGIQMDNANFGIVPIITSLSTSGMAVTLKVVAGQPSSNQNATGTLHITAIGYH